MDGADAVAGEHGDDHLQHHGHVDGHAVALLHAVVLEHVGEAAHLLQQLLVRDAAVVLGVIALPAKARVAPSACFPNGGPVGLCAPGSVDPLDPQRLATLKPALFGDPFSGAGGRFRFRLERTRGRVTRLYTTLHSEQSDYTTHQATLGEGTLWRPSICLGRCCGCVFVRCMAWHGQAADPLHRQGLDQNNSFTPPMGRVNLHLFVSLSSFFFAESCLGGLRREPSPPRGAAKSWVESGKE